MRSEFYNDFSILCDRMTKEEKISISAIIRSSIIDEGLLGYYDLTQIFPLPSNIENVKPENLIIVYDIIYKNVIKDNPRYKNFKPVEDYFTKDEIQNSKFIIGNDNSKYAKLKVLSFLTADRLSFLTTLTLQEIAEIKAQHKIKWITNMQRESVQINAFGNIVSHIKFNAKRTDEIADAILQEKFYPNTLRWHVLNNSETNNYKFIDESDGKYFVLHEGYFAEIDGQHRNRATEKVLQENPNYEMTFPIVVTIGSAQKAQSIIFQDEKREPISKEQVSSYNSNVQNKIFNACDGKFDEAYKFVYTNEQLKNNTGYILVSQVENRIGKCYQLKNESNLAIKNLSDWISEFANFVASVFYDELRGVKNAKKANKTWILSTEFFEVVILLSSLLQDNPEWETIAESILKDIDFSIENKPKNYKWFTDFQNKVKNQINNRNLKTEKEIKYV